MRLLRAVLILVSASGLSHAAHCGIDLRGLSATSGRPGDVFEMYGTWTDSQGDKKPAINMGNGHDLEIVSWKPEVLTARVPQGLRPGVHKVGVYCSDLSKGGTTSSGWMDFEVLAAAEPPQSPAVRDQRSATETEASPAPEADSEEPGIRVVPKESSSAGSGAGVRVVPKHGRPPEKERGPGNRGRLSVALLFGMIVAVFFMRRSSETTVKMPGQGMGSSLLVAPQEAPAQDAATRHGIDQDWEGAAHGVEYNVECLDGEVWTVWFDSGGKLLRSLEVNARDGRRPQVDAGRSGLVNALLDEGARYVDVGFNTDWVGAELPIDGPRLDKERAERIVGLLVRLRDASRGVA